MCVNVAICLYVLECWPCCCMCSSVLLMNWLFLYVRAIPWTKSPNGHCSCTSSSNKYNNNNNWAYFGFVFISYCRWLMNFRSMCFACSFFFLAFVLIRRLLFTCLLHYYFDICNFFLLVHSCSIFNSVAVQFVISASNSYECTYIHTYIVCAYVCFFLLRWSFRIQCVVFLLLIFYQLFCVFLC